MENKVFFILLLAYLDLSHYSFKVFFQKLQVYDIFDHRINDDCSKIVVQSNVLKFEADIFIFKFQQFPVVVKKIINYIRFSVLYVKIMFCYMRLTSYAYMKIINRPINERSLRHSI